MQIVIFKVHTETHTHTKTVRGHNERTEARNARPFHFDCGKVSLRHTHIYIPATQKCSLSSKLCNVLSVCKSMFQISMI